MGFLYKDIFPYDGKDMAMTRSGKKSETNHFEAFIVTFKIFKLEDVTKVKQ